MIEKEKESLPQFGAGCFDPDLTDSFPERTWEKV